MSTHVSLFTKIPLESQIDHHTVVGVGWSPFDAVDKARQEDLLTNTYVEAFRQLAPDMGAYVNEVSPKS
jgi:hypothetical protein